MAEPIFESRVVYIQQGVNLLVRKTRFAYMLRSSSKPKDFLLDFLNAFKAEKES